MIVLTEGHAMCMPEVHTCYELTRLLALITFNESTSIYSYHKLKLFRGDGYLIMVSMLGP